MYYTCRLWNVLGDDQEYLYLGNIMQLGRNNLEKKIDKDPAGLGSIREAAPHPDVIHLTKLK